MKFSGGELQRAEQGLSSTFSILEKGLLFAISCGLPCPLKPEGINSHLFYQESVISLGAVRHSREHSLWCGKGLHPLTKGVEG